MTWWLPLVAVAVGVLLGLLGGGGAILTVPILTTLLGQTPAQATVGSLVIVGLSSLIGALGHLRSGRVRVTEGVVFGLLGIVGATIGSRLSTQVSGPVLMSAFSVLLVLVAGLMWRRRGARTTESGTERGWLVRIAAATGVGLLTGFFGVGGGFVVVPALTLVLGLPMSAAVATSLLVVAINSTSSLAVRAVSGLSLDWGVVLPFAVLAVVGTLFGSRLSPRIDQRRLQLAFIVLLLAVAAVVGIQNIPQLV